MPETNRATHEARCSTGRTKAQVQVCDFCGHTFSSEDDHSARCEVLQSIFARQATQETCEMCGTSMSLGQMEEHKVLHMLERRVSGEIVDTEALKTSTMKSRGLSLAQIQNELPVFTPTLECLLEECIICMSKFQEQDHIRLLPCFHKFHVSCIDTWLASTISCPVCKSDI